MSAALHPGRCWFQANLTGVGPCEGRIDRCHLIKAQVIRREAGAEHVWDPRVFVPGCRLHHAALDHARSLRVPRASLPRAVEEFAAEHGLGWWVAREYGEVADAA